MPVLPRLSSAIEGRVFDVLVLGGGINGTGVARDAARRGLSVALVEKEDFGYGTTGRSTRLIHGGLRYLAMYDFGLVRESLRERERLFHNAPHLVRPLTFLIPFYKGQRTPPFVLKLGLLFYDFLAGRSVVPRHRVYSRDALLALEPGLRREGLRGGASYGDGQVPLVERLCVENVLDAAAHGAIALNHARAESVEREGDVWVARVTDLLTGRPCTLRARFVVNTTGPWLERLTGFKHVKSRMTKGIHFVAPQHTRNAVLLFSPDDDRVFFSIPWNGHQLVGTTDTDFVAEPDEVAADAADVDYLQRGIRYVLPGADVGTVHYAYAGIRNLVPEEGKSESDVSRRHQIIRQDDMPNVISLVGGKITPFRDVCEELVDLLTDAPCDTAEAPLPGAPAELASLIHALARRCREMGLPASHAETLATTFGTRAHLVLDRVVADASEGEAVCTHAPMMRAEVAFAVEAEMARTAADVLLRRTRVGWEPCEGRDALPAVLDILDRMLGRDAAGRKADEAAYLGEIAKRHRFRTGVGSTGSAPAGAGS
ncbi:MAG TPA: glycerol-3-phosphate dehydrogenase/oxidase [Candidatus Thermoplasmatota archaeon]|nr:glycerol-3-phosphate dehydrogenase/oxidase [Candidatus Thermoplasmatota archaeon]